MMKFFCAVFLFAALTAFAEPLDEWSFETAEFPGGEVIGQLKTVEQGGLRCVELTPAKDGGGGILLATDHTKAKLPKAAMTVEAWVRIDATLEWGGIIGAVRDTGAEEDGWILGYRNDRFLFGLATEGTPRITYLTSTTQFVTKEWYHVVATYDGIDQQLLYVDGKLNATSTAQRGAIDKPDPLFYTIGAYRDENDYYPFTGRLAGIAVWDEALGAGDIAKRFESRKTQFPGIEPAAGVAGSAGDGDWPTWMGDNQRSGRSADEVELHASGEPEWIYEPRQPPAPAWPEVARSDHWRKRSTPETPRATFDWVHDVVIAGGRAFFASSADGGVRCLDARTGERLWVFYAGGPVRLAPTLSDGRVVFGCDDGAVYCLDADDGKLLWKSRPKSVPDRRLPGNDHVMSVWPVRTGVLVEGNRGYFGAGLFPDEGVWYCSIDLRDGSIVEEKAVEFSPQGYLMEKGGKLLAQAGRVENGGTLGAVALSGKPRPVTLSRATDAMKKLFPHVAIETPGKVFVAGDAGVAAFAPGGERPIWQAQTDAPVRGLAIAGGRLYASTTSGRIYAFGVGSGADFKNEPVSLAKSETSLLAKRLVKHLPRERGLALVVGLDDSSLVRGLAAQSELRVVGIDTDAEKVRALREEFAADRRIEIQEVADFESLPFVDGIFNLVTGAPIPESEARRLVRPWDGLAMFTGGVEYRGKAPPGAGSWTHAYGGGGNTASSGDRGVDGDMRVRWFGRPGPEHMVDRHLRGMPPLVGGGYLIVPGRDYLFGLDAHNGTVLWERAIPSFMRASMLRDCGGLVLVPESKTVLAVSGAKCLVIDADTGVTQREIAVDAAAEEWGYLAFAGQLILGSAVDKGAIRRELSYSAIYEGGYGDGKRSVCSRRLFAYDPKTGKQRWSYQPKGAIPNPSLCIGAASGQLFFVESKNAATLEKPAGNGGVAGRWGYEALIKTAGAELVSLDLATGKERWRLPFDMPDHTPLTLYVSCAGGHLVIADSFNFAASEKVLRSLHYGVQVRAMDDGAQRWDKVLNTGRRPNLDHGEQDLHPVIAGGRLIMEPYVFDLETGDELFTFKREGGGGCGTISASANKLYFRAGNPAEFDLEKKEQAWITRATRPGCWINMIPAGGMLLVPEGSSGCICGYPVQASMGFGADAAE